MAGKVSFVPYFYKARASLKGNKMHALGRGKGEAGERSSFSLNSPIFVEITDLR
jgi:hypothetical protein